MELVEIARLEEARQARGLSEIADEFRPFAGGIAGRGPVRSWINNVVGIGMDGAAPNPGELDDLLAWYTGRGIEPRMEVAPFVSAEFLAFLEQRGLTVRGFENVFYRELDPAAVVRPLHTPPREVVIEVVDPSNPGAVREYAITASSGFYPDGVVRTEAELEIAGRCVGHPRTVAFAARVGGRVVGAGAVEVAGEICALFGLSVLHEFRRRGIQQSLIAARLSEAIRRGARLATISGRPGAATERNVRRMGFALAYTKVVMVKPGPGLTPMVG